MTSFEDMHRHDKVVMLKRIPLFASCTEPQLQLIADRTRLVEYKKGESIYREGDPADSFYIVSSGRLRVFSSANGIETIYTVLYNGDSFGEISLLTGEMHSATVQALNDALVLQLKKEDFDEVINRIPSLVLYLSRLLSKRLRTRTEVRASSDTTITATYSAVKSVGCTLFTISLAAMLRRETDREVVVVAITNALDDWVWRYGPLPSSTGAASQPSLATIISEDSFETVLTTHPLGFRVLFAGELLTNPHGEQLVAPLLSGLTKRFEYVLVDLPSQMSPPVVKALTQSDMTYLVTDATKENLTKTRVLMEQLSSPISTDPKHLQIVLNMAHGTEEKLSFFELLFGIWDKVRDTDSLEQLGHPVNFTLPYLSNPPSIGSLTQLLDGRRSPFALTIQRAARQLAGGLVGLALGSGAALGLAHIGILKVIEREKIPIDIIAGTSIGAMIAALWASGHSAEELERLALRFKHPWQINRLFLLDIQLPIASIIAGVVIGGLVGWMGDPWTGVLAGLLCIIIGLILGMLTGGPIQGSQLMARLQADFENKTFEDTWIPVKVVAANPLTREEVIIDSGSLAEAVRGSVSIPGIFKPVTYRGQLCLDGGVVNPIPVSVLKQAGVKRIIAVNVFPTPQEIQAYRRQVEQHRLEREAQLASRSLPVRLLILLRQELVRSMSPLVFDVIMRSMQWMEYQIAEIDCRGADLTLRPTVAGAHWLEFFNPEKFIRRGEEVAMAHLAELKRVSGVHKREESLTSQPQTQYDRTPNRESAQT